MISFLSRLFRSYLILLIFLLCLSARSYAADPQLTVNLIGCGAQLGQISGPRILSGSDYLVLDKVLTYPSFRMTDDLGTASGRILNPDELSDGWTAPSGSVVWVRVQHELVNNVNATHGGWRLAEFKGFSGACEGQGNRTNQKVPYIRNYHDCIFNMPLGGTFLNAQYEVTYQSSDVSGSLICATPPAGNEGSGKPLPTALDGAAFVGAIGDAAANLMKSFGLKKLLQVAALSINYPTAANDGSFTITVSAQDAATLSPLSAELAAAPQPYIVIAKASSLLDGGNTSNLLLTLKKTGRNFLKGKKLVRMYVAVRFQETASGKIYKATTKTFRVR